MPTYEAALLLKAAAKVRAVARGCAANYRLAMAQRAQTFWSRFEIASRDSRIRARPPPRRTHSLWLTACAGGDAAAGRAAHCGERRCGAGPAEPRGGAAAVPDPRAQHVAPVRKVCGMDWQHPAAPVRRNTFMQFHASPKALHELQQLLRRETDIVRFNIVKTPAIHTDHVRAAPRGMHLTARSTSSSSARTRATPSCPWRCRPAYAHTSTAATHAAQAPSPPQ